MLRADGHSMQDWAVNPEKNKTETEKEEEEKDDKIEKDDPETLKKAREWDDYRDGEIIFYQCLNVYSI